MTASPADLAKNWYQVIWNERNLDALSQLATPDCKMRTGTGANDYINMKIFTEIHNIYHSKFHDIHFEVIRTTDNGKDEVAAVTRVTFTHKGKQVSSTGATFLTFKDCKLAEAWNFNHLDMLIAMGLIPENAFELAIEGKLKQHPQVEG